MKNIILLVSIFSSSFVSFGQSDSATALASRMAARLTDSLALTTEQRDALYNVNVLLAEQKAVARQQSVADSIRIRVQRIENTRDALYQSILTTEQYGLYRLKKKHLVTGR